MILYLKKNKMDDSKIMKKIVALEKAALEAWHKGNPSKFLELYSMDYTYFDPIQELRIDSKEEIKQLYDSFNGKMEIINTFEMINPKVQISGKIAVLTYNLHSSLGDKIYKENCTEVYKLEDDDEWRIIHSHWSLTQPLKN